MRMLLATFLALGTVSTVPAIEHLPEFEATYTVRYGLLRGTLVLHLSRQGERYVYETSLRPRGIAALFARGTIQETTHLIENGPSIQPLDYESTDTIADPPRITRYVFHQDRVTGSYKEQPVELPMQAGGQNRVSVHIAVMHALRNGADVAAFAIFDRSRWKEYRFEVLPGRTVETPSGRRDTIEVRYSSPGNEKSSSLYFAPSLEFLPVLIVYSENGRVKTRAELIDYRIAATDGAPEPQRPEAAADPAP